MQNITTRRTVTRHTLTSDQADDLVAAAALRDQLTGRVVWGPATEEQRVQWGVELHHAESRVPGAVMRAALAEAPLLHPEWTLEGNMFAWLREQQVTG